MALYVTHGNVTQCASVVTRMGTQGNARERMLDNPQWKPYNKTIQMIKMIKMIKTINMIKNHKNEKSNLKNGVNPRQSA